MMDQSLAARGRGSTSNPSGKEISKVAWQKLRDNALNKTEFYAISQQSELLPELRTDLVVFPQLEALEFYERGEVSNPEFSENLERECRSSDGDTANSDISLSEGSENDYVSQPTSTEDDDTTYISDSGDSGKKDYVPQTTMFYRSQYRERISGYRREISLQDILESYKEGQLSFIGQAGSGKTTLLKAITRQVIEGKYKNLSDIEVVHFVNLRTFKRNDSVTPAELLFRNVTPEMSDVEMEEAMQYANDNPGKMLFVIDSLDTVPYTIDGVYTGITIDDRASPEAILFHLLSGNLLPGCRFITSSREYAIRNYKGDVRAKQVIALAGFTKESMRKIVVGYVGEEEAEEKMTYLTRKPVIESLCATPVWLIFTLMVLSIKSQFTPTTMAGILVVLLQTMIRSEHVHEGNIEVFVGKLGNMAFTGTKEHRVEFSLDELSKFNLFASEICDLMIATPSGGYQKLLLGDSILMFAHPCLQEILAAFHIAKMNLKEFEDFISEYIHTPHYAVVRRLLTGILLNNEAFEEAENFLEDATDFVQKRLCLRKSLEEQLEMDLSKEDQFELFICLSECGDEARDISRNQVVNFDFHEMSLSPSEMYSIGWVMSQQTFVTTLNLSECIVTQTSLSALYHGLENSNVQLHELDISYNKTLGPAEMTIIAKIFVQCKVKLLKLWQSQLKSDALKAFLNSSFGAKLHELDITGNDNTGPDEMKVIALIFVQCEVNVLNLATCQLKLDGLQAFLDSSVGGKLHELNFSFNETFGPDEMRVIAKIFVQCKVNILKLGGCEPKSEALKAFLDSSVGAKLDELDVSNNTFGPDEMMMIAQICKQREVDRFCVDDCEFLSGALESFLLHSVGAKISLLHVGVIRLKDHKTTLGKVIKQCGVETLVTNSPENLNSIDIEDLKISSDNFKISKLKCRQTDNEDDEDDDSFGDSVGKFLPYVAKEVILINYYITSRIEEILQNLLDEGRNKGLKISIKEDDSEDGRGEEIEQKVLQCTERSAENVPSIVENRRAELNNDGSITVSWHYPIEDSDVRYHVETFCNDQPTGDIEICGDTYYQCKTRRPSQVHCFKICVVDSNGIAGDAIFTNEVMSYLLDKDALPGTSIARDVLAQSEKGTEQDIAAGSIVRDERTQTMTKGISHPVVFERNPVVQIPRITTQENFISSARGGKIKSGNCGVKFPPGLLKHDANIKITVESGEVSDRSKLGIPISPTLGCDLSHVGLVPGFKMEVKILAYCFASEPVTIALLSKTSNSEDWVIEMELMLGRDRKLKFKTSSFSRKYYVFMRTIGLGRFLNFPVTPHLYYNKFGGFKCYLCVEDQSIIDGIKTEHKSSGFTSALILPEPLLAKLGESIRLELQCVYPTTASFSNSNSYELISDKLIDKVYVRRDFALKDIPDQIDRGCIEVHVSLAKVPPEEPPTPMICWIVWPMFSDGDQREPRAGTAGAIVDVEEARRQAPPPDIPDPKLVLDKTKIRVSWDKLEDERVTYYIDLYCDGQKQNPEPRKTPATNIEFSELEPSCEYRCEVWARNSHGHDGLKTWSNAVKTDHLRKRRRTSDAKEGKGSSSQACLSPGPAPINITHSTITVSATTTTKTTTQP